MVQNSVMALMPELLRGLQAASLSCTGSQPAKETHDEGSAPSGWTIGWLFGLSPPQEGMDPMDGPELASGFRVRSMFPLGVLGLHCAGPGKRESAE